MKSPGDRKRVWQFRMPADLVSRFDAAATVAGQSRSGWLESAMREALEQGFMARVRGDDVLMTKGSKRSLMKITITPDVATAVDKIASDEGLTRTSYLVLAALSCLARSS